MTIYKSLQPGFAEEQAKKLAAYKASRAATKSAVQETTQGETDVAKIVDINPPRSLKPNPVSTQATTITPPATPTAAGVPTTTSAVQSTSFNVPVIERDYAREQAAIKKIGGDVNSLANLDPKKLFEMTYTPQELKGLEDYQALLKYDTAKDSLLQTPKPTNTMMAALEDALRTKSDPAKQQMGTSELFKLAGIPTEGVSGYTTLMQSMNSQSAYMGAKYDSFVNQLTRTAGAMRDTYNTVADTYNLLKTDYDQQVAYTQKLADNIMQQEQAMDLLDRQYALEQEAAIWANNNPSYADQTNRMNVQNAGSIDSYNAQTSRMNAENAAAIDSFNAETSFYNAETARLNAGTSRSQAELDKLKYEDEKAMNEAYNDALNGQPEGSGQFKAETILGGGTVTGIDGSKYWKAGLDVVLEGGKGAPVKAPLAGMVIKVDSGHKPGEENSFGNQVQIRQVDGRIVWLSHLDSINVTEGQMVEQGDVIGGQGNTGTTYGATGIHVDVTYQRPDGSFYTARETEAYLEALLKVNAPGMSPMTASTSSAFSAGRPEPEKKLAPIDEFHEATGIWPDKEWQAAIVRLGVKGAIESYKKAVKNKLKIDTESKTQIEAEQKAAEKAKQQELINNSNGVDYQSDKTV